MPQTPDIPEKLPPTDSDRLARERRREINASVDDIQLRYADAKYAKAPEAAHETFAQFLDAETYVVEDVRKAIGVAERIGPEDDQSPIAAKVAELMRRIDDLKATGGEGWRKEVMALLNGAREGHRAPRDYQPKRIGLLEYVPAGAARRVEQLAPLGLKPGDEYVEVHFRAPALNPDEKFGPAEIKASMEKLAAAVVEEAPQARAVIGKSWLMDTPIAKRLGFKEVPCESHRRKGMNVWLQFLDQKGNLDEKRVKALLETGEPPYPAKLGAIPIEEFLERYLPKEMRGKELVLKELKPDWRDPEPDIKEASERLKSAWASMTDVEAYVREDKPLAALLDRYGLLGEFLNDLKDAKAQGLDWNAARSRPSAAAVSKVLRERIRAGKYRDRKVVIPEK